MVNRPRTRSFRLRPRTRANPDGPFSLSLSFQSFLDKKNASSLPSHAPFWQPGAAASPSWTAQASRGNHHRLPWCPTPAYPTRPQHLHELSPPRAFACQPRAVCPDATRKGTTQRQSVSAIRGVQDERGNASPRDRCSMPRREIGRGRALKRKLSLR